MTLKTPDPRITQTRRHAIDATTKIICAEGIAAVTHQSVSLMTGISRSTLYRHWPDLASLLNDTYKTVSDPPSSEFSSLGSLADDLKRLVESLVFALEETEWGRMVPQIVASAAVDVTSTELLHGFVAERLLIAEQIIVAAKTRNEITASASAEDLLVLTISPIYYRKLLAGLPLDQGWIARHIAMISRVTLGG